MSRWKIVFQVYSDLQLELTKYVYSRFLMKYKYFNPNLLDWLYQTFHLKYKIYFVFFFVT